MEEMLIWFVCVLMCGMIVIINYQWHARHIILKTKYERLKGRNWKNLKKIVDLSVKVDELETENDRLMFGKPLGVVNHGQDAILSHSNTEPFDWSYCPQCSKPFENADELGNHVVSEHLSNDYPPVENFSKGAEHMCIACDLDDTCIFCGKDVKPATQFHGKYLDNVILPTLKCFCCEFTCRSQIELDQHLFYKHNKI